MPQYAHNMGKISDNNYVEQKADANGNFYEIMANSLIPKEFDYISLGYTGDDITSVIYKTGGAGGTTVATLAITYDGSHNILTVTRT